MAEDGFVVVRHELVRVVIRLACGLACAGPEAASRGDPVDERIRQVALRCGLCFAVQDGVALGGNVADASRVAGVLPLMYSVNREEKMDDDARTFRGSCHCGAVRFQVRLTDGLNTARRCNCSYCSMRGAIAVTAALPDIAITAGKEMLTLYQFNTMQAKHYFCSKCGIYTHHQRRSNPTQYGFNVACIEGVDPYALGDIKIVNGAGQSLVSKQ